MTSQPYVEPLVFDFEIRPMHLRDLTPKEDPKGCGPPPAPFSPGSDERPKKPKSDQIRNITLQDYIAAQSHPSKNGEGGLKGFFRSNLFVGIILWVLSQAVILGGSFALTYARTNQLIEWKANTDATLKRMDEWGTTHGHYADEREDAAIVDLQTRQKVLTEVTTTITQAMTIQSERNNQQDKQIAEITAQESQIATGLVEIKTKLAVVADLLDERTKSKR